LRRARRFDRHLAKRFRIDSKMGVAKRLCWNRPEIAGILAVLYSIDVELLFYGRRTIYRFRFLVSVVPTVCDAVVPCRWISSRSFHHFRSSSRSSSINHTTNL
jgi:hypothetical protein